MVFTTDGEVHESLDSTTSYETQESSDSTIYTRNADGTEPQREDGTAADEVDPRKLLPDPSVDELRWLARTSWGGALITKPIDDAFKFGYEVVDPDDGTEAAGVKSVLEGLDWEYHYKRAQKKARRDGFALVFAVINDDGDVEDDPFDDDIAVEDVNKLQVLRLDDLSKFDSEQPGSALGEGRDSLEKALASSLEQDESDLEVRRTGIVIDKNPNSDSYREPVGYLVGKDDPRDLEEVNFVHRNRIVHHLVWNNWVDSDLDSDTLGEYEGDSILTPSYHLMRGLKKGNWAIMQTLFRYAAKLYHVALPEDADDEDFDEAYENITNMNAMSELVTPFGYEIDDFGTEGQLEPRDYFDVMFEQVCAGQEMTKSVLFGTQTGTVSGSETDIKNYFNQVERMRHGRVEDDMRGFLTWYRRLVDDRANPEEFQASFDVDWGPLFRVSEIDHAEVLSRKMQTLVAAIRGFVLTPMEARSIMREEWAEFDMVVDDDDLSAEEREFIENMLVAQMGTEATLTDPSEQAGFQGSTQQQNGGGREQGRTSDPQNPASDSLSQRDVDRIADALTERLQDG